MCFEAVHQKSLATMRAIDFKWNRQKLIIETHLPDFVYHHGSIYKSSRTTVVHNQLILCVLLIINCFMNEPARPQLIAKSHHLAVVMFEFGKHLLFLFCGFDELRNASISNNNALIGH